MLIRKSKTVCFLGETVVDKALCFYIFALADRFVSAGFNTFLFSADSLFSLECAMQILLRKKKQVGNFPDKINLIAFVPFENHINKKDEKFRIKYFSVLEKCDDIMFFSKDEDEFIFSDFTEFIIDKSSIVVCPENGAEYEELFAGATGRKIIKAVTK